MARRLLLRKSALFGKLPEQPMKMHPPAAERSTPDGGKLVLVRSDKNSRVRRWRRASKQAALHYGETARQVLREAFDRGGEVFLTRARLEHPEVRALVDHGLLELHQEPRHHAYDFRGTLTKAGREYMKRYRANADRISREAQTPMFKARIVFRKAMQLGLFGVRAHAPAVPDQVPAGTGVTQVAARPAFLAPADPNDFSITELEALRAKVGVIVPGAGGAERDVYRLKRFFYVTPKGAEPIRPVEVLTRRHQVPGSWIVGKGVFKETKTGWKTLGSTQFLREDGTWGYGPPDAVARFPGGKTRTVEAQEMDGYYKETVPCDARCTEARGHKCECSCGGVNHGKGSQITYAHRTPGEIKALIRKHGKPEAPTVLRKAADGGAGAAPAGPGGAARGLRLMVSRANPRVKRWEREQEPAKPPSDHVRFMHPDTGKERTGQVIAEGPKGVTVVDHETGTTAKVEHGHYVVSDPPGKEGKGGPARQPASGSGRTGHVGTGMAPHAGASEPTAPAYREKYPGLNKYPPPGVVADEGGKADDWKLRWRSPGTGKMVQAYETAYLRENAKDKFHRINQVAHRLPDLRATLDAHMSLHPSSPAAVKAAMVRMVDHTAMRAGNEDSATKGVHGVSTLLKKHARVEGDKVHLDYVGKSSVPQQHTVHDPKVAAIVRHLQTLPGDRLFQHPDGKGGHTPVTADHLNDYVRSHLGDDHTLKDLRTFHATRLFSEAADKLGPPKGAEDAEEKIQGAALEVAKHLGHKKASTRGHFAVHGAGEADHDQVVKHGGKLYMHGDRRAVGFHTAAEKRAYVKATGAEDLPKAQHPSVEGEWLHEPTTSLNNYIDPTVVEAYRKGLTLSGSMRKAVADAGEHLSADERRFIAHLGKVADLDPYKFRGAQP